MSNTDYYTTAVSFGDLKNGMLYFDKLIPITLSLDFAKDFATRNRDSFREVINSVGDEIFPDLLKSPDFNESLCRINLSSYHMLLKHLQADFSFEKKIAGLTEEQYQSVEKNFIHEYFNFIYKYNLGDYPLVSDGNGSMASMKDDTTLVEPAILTLANLNLIDASQATWEQLVEFRKDKTAKAKLQKLRLFAYENYTGKSKSYIEDDINGKIYDYENTAKKFGLLMIQAAVNNVINSKLFSGLITGSILTTLFAEHPIGLITTGSSVVIEFGLMTLELKKQKYELQELVKDNPASFITFYRDKHDDKQK